MRRTSSADRVRLETRLQLPRLVRFVCCGVLVIACAPSDVEPGSAQPAAPLGQDEQDVSARRRCPIVERGTCRAVRAGDTKTLVNGAGVVMPGATFTLADRSFAAFAPIYDRGAVVLVTSLDLVQFSAPREVTGMTADVTGAIGAGGAALYFVGGSGPAAGLYRSSVGAGGAVGTPAAITIPGVTSVPYWPQAAGLADGRVLLAFVEPQKRAFLAVSADGVTFEQRATPVPPGDRRGILAHVGTTKGGSWIFTHQQASASSQWTSFVHLSDDDGRTWSAPIVVAPEATDVHDAYPIARTDKGADLYYLHVGARGVFSAHRRALLEDGALGPEQVVTAPDVGHIEKPQARRLPDGRIALTFAVRKSDGAYDVNLAILEGDAPLR